MKNLALFYFFLLFIIPYLPRLDSIDIIGAHWFYLSVLNLFSCLYLSTRYNYFVTYFKNPVFKLYSLFLFLVLFSLLYSNNLNVSIVDTSRIFSTFLTVIASLFFLDKIKIDHILNLIFFSLLIDFVFVYYYVVEYFYFNSFSIIDFQSIYKESLFRGFSGNKNIMATFLLLKFPVSLYLYFTSSFKKSLFFIPFFIIFYITIFLLNSRASFLSLSIIILLTLLYYSHSFKKHFYKKIGVLFSLISSYVIFTHVLFFNSADVSIISEVNSIEFSAKSSSHRFLLWDNALNYIYQNPLFGAGIGNWKIESAPYWKTELSDFIVPYHAHNDFLELSTEIGIVGGVTYLLIFIFIFYYLIKRILKFLKFSNLYFLLFSSFLIYFVDASLNFPLERTIIQIFFSFFLALFLFNFLKLTNE